MKKTITIILCCLLCIGCFTACLNKNEGNAKTLAAPPSIKMTYIDQTTDGFKTIYESSERFSAKLAPIAAAACSEKENSNFAFSPLSIYMALALAAQSGSETVRNEITTAMGISYEDLNTNFSDFFCYLTYEKKDDNDKIIAQNTFTNSIWLQDGYDFDTDCLSELADNYYCYAKAADFANDNKNANKAIESFIKERTNGLINNVPQISSDAIFAIINTHYLKTAWDSMGSDLQFTPDHYDFTFTDGTKKSTQLLMSNYYPGKVVTCDKYSFFNAITSNGMKLYFILPNDGYSVKDIYTEETLYNVRTSKYITVDEEKNEHYLTRCLFPEYKAESSFDAKEILKKDFGINTMFSDGNNFSSLINTPNNFCSKIQHVAKLNVNKKGIEGAAATILEGNATSIQPMTIVKSDFIIDRAFAFVITNSSNSTLFSGIVNSI